MRARFQVNILIRPDPHLRIFNDIRETFIPVLWFEQYVKLDESNAKTLKLILAVPWIGKIFGIILAVIGFFIVIVWPCLANRRKPKESQTPSFSEDAIQPPVQIGKEVRPLLDRNANSAQVQVIAK